MNRAQLAPKHASRRPDELAGEHMVRAAAELVDCGPDLDRLAQRLSVLSDPRRLKILFTVHAHPGIRSSAIAQATGTLESTTSHALTLLRDAGWLRARRHGREIRYEIAEPLGHRILHELGSTHLPGVEHVGGTHVDDHGR